MFSRFFRESVRLTAETVAITGFAYTASHFFPLTRSAAANESHRQLESTDQTITSARPANNETPARASSRIGSSGS